MGPQSLSLHASLICPWFESLMTPNIIGLAPVQYVKAHGVGPEPLCMNSRCESSISIIVWVLALPVVPRFARGLSQERLSMSSRCGSCTKMWKLMVWVPNHYVWTQDVGPRSISWYDSYRNVDWWYGDFSILALIKFNTISIEKLTQCYRWRRLFKYSI